jgi:DNA-binding IclR family transcriptional regulator
MKVEMKTSAQHVNPEEYVLAVLSPQERLEAALQIAHEAFKGTSLTLGDVEAAVKKVRRRFYAERQKKAKGRR